MNIVSPGKTRKLAAKKIVFPALFGLIALASQMMGPVAYLYAKGGGTVSLNADVISSSIYCVSMKINGSSQRHPHIHQHPKQITFADVANPGTSGTMQTFKDHTCKGTALNTILIKIPNSPTLSKCTIDLGAKPGQLKCQ